MKIGPIFTVAVLIGATEVARAEAVESKITVYVQNDASVPAPLLSFSRNMASEMFAGVGVKINWRPGSQISNSRVSQNSSESVISSQATTDAPKVW